MFEGVDSDEPFARHEVGEVGVAIDSWRDLDRLFAGSDLSNLNVGFIVFHRSSVFGMFAESKGGVNFMGFGIEARF